MKRDTVYVSHNVSGDFFLHRLDKSIREKWSEAKVIKFDRNKLLPIDNGFIYDADCCYMFRIKKGQFEFSAVSADELRIAMIKNELNPGGVIKQERGN